MYIREKTFTNKDGSIRTYLQLVENARENGKIRQRVICNLGRLEELKESGQLERLTEAFSRYAELKLVKDAALKINPGQDKEWGPSLIFRSLWQELGLDAVIGKLVRRSDIEFNIDAALFAMTLNRLSDPFSKLGVSKWVPTVHNPAFESLELHHFYRSLDWLAEHKDILEQHLFEQVRDLFHLKLDLVFWDTTSTYFEGSGPEALAKFGHSKDRRSDRVQIIIGLLMTQEGIPVAHEIFPGNMNGTKSFAKALEIVKERFDIEKIILVGDRGMVSASFLKEIEKQGMEYVVRVRMRKIRSMEDVLSRRGRYHEVRENLKVKEVRHEDDRYIVCFNPEEAVHDRQSREQIIKRLDQKLKADGIKSLVGNSGYRHFLKVTGGEIAIDEETVTADERYDGKYVLKTNNYQLTPEQIALAYKDLWIVERAFREMKSGLDLRPIYHFRDSRVRGHVMICFLAFLLESTFRRHCQEEDIKVSYGDLMLDLKQVRAIELKLNDKHYLLRSSLYGKCYEAFKAVGLRPPSEVTELP